MALPIRLRLAFATAVLIAALVTVAGVIVYLRLEADLVATVDDGLAERAQLLLDDPPSGHSIPEAAADVGDVFAAIVAPDGQIVSSTAGFPPSVIGPTFLTAVNGPRSFERTIPNDQDPTVVRLLATPGMSGQVIVTGVAFDDQRDTLSALRTELALALPVAVLLAVAVGWFIGGAALRPVERMRIEAEAISESELGRRLPVPATGDELAALGRSLNRMLERLQTAVERERRLVDDASHELRTPLANLKAELDLALRRARTEPELLDALRSALEETDRVTRLAADLLVLARADRGSLPVHPRDVDIGSLVAGAVGRVTGRASSEGVTLDVIVEPGLRARIDPDRVGQALDDLVDNALRHTPRGGAVTVRGTRDRASVRLAVADDGPGFPKDFLVRAFEPFARADGGRRRTEGGVGLGLTMVRAVARAHGGSVAAINRSDGTGAEVAMTLPSAEPLQT